MFVITWAVALLIWRYGRIEDRWGPADLGTETAT
jgi:high-affinity nickel-transport protein